MTIGNQTWQIGDITGDIYFDYLRSQNRDPVPFMRMYLMIDGNSESKPVKGLRILVYGTNAEIMFAHLQKGQPDRGVRTYSIALQTEFDHSCFSKW